MKTGTITFQYFQADDYVRTPMGCGIVMEDEKYIKSAIDLIYSKVKIKHKFGCSENPTNEPVWYERALILHINYVEYGSE